MSRRSRHFSFIVYIKTDDTYKDIAQYIETTFNTSKYELERRLLKKTLLEEEFGWNVMKEFAGLK